MEQVENQSGVMKDFMKSIDGLMQIVDSYEVSRPGSMVFTKLEEAILWMNVLVTNVPLKNKEVCSEIKPLVNNEMSALGCSV